VESGMYRDKTLSVTSSVYSPFDPMYVLVDFKDLAPGTYTLLTDWKTPWGSLEHQSVHTFGITDTAPSYRVLSWLRLWKNGPFKRALSGEEYNKEFYGMWEVILYLNGDEVTRHQFEVR